MIETVISLLSLSIPIVIILIFFIGIRLWWMQLKNEDKPTNKIYVTHKKCLNILGIILCIAIVLSFICSSIKNREENEKKKLEKIEEYAGEDLIVFEQKYNNLIKSMNDKDAKLESIKYVEKNQTISAKIDTLSEEDKDFFEMKFKEHNNNNDILTAKEKALEELHKEQNRKQKEKYYAEQKEREELQKAAEEERIAKEKECKDLQKKYDDQAQYEEWIAWQKAEAEKKAEEERKIAEEKERQELQKKYDDQARYEEWIAWQKSEEEKRQAEINKYQTIDAYDLHYALESNAARANRDYSGKYVKITGAYVDEVKMNGNKVNMGIKRSFSISSFLWCYPKTEAAKEALYEMSNGQRITVYGKIREIDDFLSTTVEVDVDRFEW